MNFATTIMNTEEKKDLCSEILIQAYNHINKGDYQSAKKILIEGIEEVELTAIEDYAAVYLYEELASVLEELEEFDKAITCYLEYSDFIQACHGEFSEEAALTYIHLSELYKIVDNTKFAELYLLRALRNYSSKNENLPQVHFDLATIYAERGDHAKAKEHFEQAYAASVEINGKKDEITLFIKEELERKYPQKKTK